LRPGVRAGLALAALSASALPAVPQAIEPGREGALAELVPPVPGRSACFARRYDAAHLKAHPVQQVTSLALRIRYHRHAPDAANPAGQRNYYFTLAATTREREAPRLSSGECSAPGASIVCAVECDGGGFRLLREGPGSLLLDLTRFGRLRLSRSCQEGDEAELTPGRDDRRFRLEPVDASRCAFADE
jgi:hypothetical protein